MISVLLTTAVVASASISMVIPAEAKKHTECFKDGSDDGKDHPFDASRFDRCGKNYQDGFLKGCKDAGNNEETCQSSEDNQGLIVKNTMHKTIMITGGCNNIINLCF